MLGPEAEQELGEEDGGACRPGLGPRSRRWFARRAVQLGLGALAAPALVQALAACQSAPGAQKKLTWSRGDDLRTQAYLAQRFASASVPTDAELSQAYARSKAEFDKAGMTFEQASAVLRERLIVARRRELITDWLSDLRRRTDVVILQQ